MENNVENSETEENQEIAEETSAASEALKMQTFSRLPGGVDESDSEKMKRILSLLHWRTSRKRWMILLVQ